MTYSTEAQAPSKPKREWKEKNKNQGINYALPRTRILRALSVASAVLFVIGLYLALFWVGPEKQQGAAQRIFYVHLGSFLGAFIAFGAVVVAGIAYLRSRDNRWDVLGLSSVEIGLGMSAITIVTGMAWARPIWNTWWTWDPRLTSITIMWLAYAAYIMLRSGIEDPERRRRFAAVFGIIAFASVLFTIIIIRVRPDTIHPVVAGPSESDPEGGFEIAGRIRTTLFFNLFTFAVITTTLLWYRVRLENLSDWVLRRKMQLAD